MRTLFLLIFLGISLPKAYGQSYPLTCRGGDSMRLSIESGNYGVTGTTLVGTYERGQLARRPMAGQCVWDDRAVGSGEPNRFCLQINEQNLLLSNVPRVLGVLGGGGTVRLQVYNNGSGCMLVRRLDSIPGPSRQGKNTTLQAIIDALGGRAEGVPSPLTLPIPPNLTQPLRLHSQTLRRIAQVILTDSTFREVADYELSACDGNAFCSSRLWETALALQVGVQ